MNINSEIIHPAYWDNRYTDKSDHWTLNSTTPPFVHLIEKKIYTFGEKLLVLGAGIGHDAIFAAQKGFDVTALDFSTEALNKTKLLADSQNVHINLCEEDIFNLHRNSSFKFDVIYEYVTFCSVPILKRMDFLKNVDSIMNKNGYYITVLFPVTRQYDGPPFQVDMMEFHEMASKFWRMIYLQKNIPSIKPRKGNEVLIIYKK